jgi:hypothetical protein
MPTISSGRLALATSSLALVVAIGGTGYAVATIGTADLKNNAVTSAKIKNNTITGRDVNEQSLGVVEFAEWAADASSAHDAETAKNVNGVVIKEINYIRPQNTGPEGVLDTGTFGITALCHPGADLEVIASTNAVASIYVTAWTDVDPEDPVATDLEDFTFDPGDAVDLLVGTPGNNTTIQVTYNTRAGHVVTLDLVADETVGECSLRGHAIIS